MASARPWRVLLATVATGFAATLLAACGGSSGASTGGGASGGKWPASPAGTWGKEPTIVVPKAAPPTHLVKEDLITGHGPEAKTGDNVTVQYVGVTYSTKKVFDSSWSRHQPFAFQLGGQVITGWNEGVAGMKVGGRRELIIPPALAYQSQSPGAGIPPNATLIFIVDLLSVQPPA